MSLILNVSNRYSTNQPTTHRNDFYAAGLWWVFYNNPVGRMYYTTSADGVNWAAPVFFSYCLSTVSVTLDTLGRFHMARVRSGGGHVQYALMQPNSDGSLSTIADWQDIWTNEAITESTFEQDAVVFLDTAGKPWIYYSYFMFDDPKKESFGFIDHSTTSNGTWTPAGGNFPYLLKHYTTDDIPFWANYGAEGALMVSHPDGTVQWLATIGPENTFQSWLFSDTALLSTFDTGILTNTYAHEFSAIITNNDRLFMTATGLLNGVPGQHLVELSKTGIIRDMLIGYSGYSALCSFDPQSNSIIAIAASFQVAGFSLDGRDILYWQYSLDHNFLSAPRLLVQGAFANHPGNTPDEWMEAVQLSLNKKTIDDHSEFLLTYLSSITLASTPNFDFYAAPLPVFDVPVASQFNLTILSPEGGTIEPAPGIYSHATGESVILTAIPAEENGFVYWIIDGVNNTSNPVTIVMNSDHTVQAMFGGLTPPPPPVIPKELIAIGIIGGVVIAGITLSRR